MATNELAVQEVPTALQRYWWAVQQPGDVLFTKAKGFGPLANVLAQTAISGRKARASHVILCVVPGLYAHAVIEQGVKLQMAEDLPIFVTRHEAKNHTEGTFLVRVFRRRGLTDDPQHAMKIVEAAGYFIGQRYNSLFFTKRHLSSIKYQDSSSFCSELVAAVFNKLAKPLGTDRPEMLLPVHLEQLLTGPEWEDVTARYIDTLLRIESGTDTHGDLRAIDQLLKLHLREQACVQLNLISYQVWSTRGIRLFKNLTDFLITHGTSLDQDTSLRVWNEVNEHINRLSRTLHVNSNVDSFAAQYEVYFDAFFGELDREPISFVEKTQRMSMPMTTKEVVAEVRSALEIEIHYLKSLRDSLEYSLGNLKTAFPDQTPELPKPGSSVDELVHSEAFRMVLAMAITATDDKVDTLVKKLKDAMDHVFIDVHTFVDQYQCCVNAFTKFVERLRCTNFVERHKDYADDVERICHEIFPRCLEMRKQIFQYVFDLDVIEKQIAAVRNNTALLELVGLVPQNRQRW